MFMKAKELTAIMFNILTEAKIMQIFQHQHYLGSNQNVLIVSLFESSWWVVENT